MFDLIKSIENKTSVITEVFQPQPQDRQWLATSAQQLAQRIMPMLQQAYQVAAAKTPNVKVSWNDFLNGMIVPASNDVNADYLTSLLDELKREVINRAATLARSNTTKAPTFNQ